MISATSIDLKGTLGDKVKLSEKVFGVSSSDNSKTVAVRVYMSNQRKSSAKSKTRSEVTRTTAKMYRQKGTGRARHGAASAPIFVGGGVAHGPSGEQNYKRKMSKKMSKRVFASVLSEKAAMNKVFVLSEDSKLKGKTKDSVMVIKKLPDLEGELLVISGIKQELVRRSFRNVPCVTSVTPSQLNSYVVIRSDLLLFTTEGLKETVDLVET